MSYIQLFSFIKSFHFWIMQMFEIYIIYIRIMLCLAGQTAWPIGLKFLWTLMGGRGVL